MIAFLSITGEVLPNDWQVLFEGKWIMEMKACDVLAFFSLRCRTVQKKPFRFSMYTVGKLVIVGNLCKGSSCFDVFFQMMSRYFLKKNGSRKRKPMMHCILKM